MSPGRHRRARPRLRWLGRPEHLTALGVTAVIATAGGVYPALHASDTVELSTIPLPRAKRLKEVSEAPTVPHLVTTPVAVAPASPKVKHVSEPAVRVASPPPPPPAETTPSAVVTSPVPVPRDSAFGSRLVYLAALQAGKPYVYGAEGPSSFDCSGLVQYLYKQLGRSVPRTTDAQYAASTKIPQVERQPGDLIFFGTPGNIYHVGIYAGAGQMWAAPHAGAVVSLRTIWTSDYHVGRL